jgi:hypothetical protein
MLNNNRPKSPSGHKLRRFPKTPVNRKWERGGNVRSRTIAASFPVLVLIVFVFNIGAWGENESAQSVAQGRSGNSSTEQSSTQSTSGSSDGCKNSGQFTIDPASARIAPGGTLTFTASAPKGCTVPALTWSIDTGLDKSLVVTITSKGNSGGSNSADLTLQGDNDERARDALRKDIEMNPTKGVISVTATAATSSGSSSSQTARATVTPQPVGNIVIPIIGFEQAGASAAQSSQKFFFNLFLSRPLPFGGNQVLADGTDLGTRYRLFGNVRIATYPQQVTSGVAEFAAGFASQVAKLKVNQLAQAGEFNLGFDWRLKSTSRGLYSLGSSLANEYTLLSIVAGFGAISPLNPQDSLQVFATPPAGSPQRAPFLNQFPTSATSTYTGFVSPDRGRFYWEYGAGLRLTTLYFDKSGIQGSTPAMLTYTLGQNQVVSGGVSSGVVQRIEGFFPLPLGDFLAKNVTTLYLFGRVDMRLAHPMQTTPFILQPAPAGISGFDSDVNIVSVRSNRDLYTIGVGVDAVKLINSIANLGKK